VLRYFLLSTHYRGPIDFSDEALHQAWAGLDNLYDLFLRLEEPSNSAGYGDEEMNEILNIFPDSFNEAMDDDFNTPVALAKFQTLRGEINLRLLTGGLSHGVRTNLQETLRKFGRVLGIFQVPTKDWKFRPVDKSFGEKNSQLSDDALKNLINKRNEARKRKDFKRADEIRKFLASEGIIIEDKPDGTSRWKR
ncbi:MAG: cysteine--tRNA ligase, partial [Nitrospirae bacterium]